MKKKMTPSEYAKLRNITLSAVTKQIRQSADLPSVSKIEKFGRFYLLTVNMEDKWKISD
jgi:hypothetical protein